MNYIRHLWTLKPIIATILAFLLPIKLAVSYSPDMASESKCAYVIVVMAILWLTEAIPIPVTALLPICLFPLLRVVKASDISSVYVKDTTMLFLGGLIISVGLEESRLHTRISLCVMRVVGAQPIFLMAGLMATTWFLSMWISNTAATSMMIPIIEAVMKNMENVQSGALGAGRYNIEATGRENVGYESSESDMTSTDSVHPGEIQLTVSPRHNSGNHKSAHFHRRQHSTSSDIVRPKGLEIRIHAHPNRAENSATPNVKETNIDKVNQNGPSLSDSAGASGGNPDDRNAELQRIAKAFALSVAYGANIGGIATLTGTPPNLVLKQEADKLFGSSTGAESDISFAKWMGFAFPLSLITAVLGWLWLILVFLRCRCFGSVSPEQRKAINADIKEQFHKLGRLSFKEIEVLLVFILLVILWLFRAPPNIGGWGKFNSLEGFVSDSTPCILLSILLFLLPANVPKVFGFAKGGNPSYSPILNWKTVVQKLPWGVIVLLGGGFAIAKASEDSGLSMWLGKELGVFASMDRWVMNLIICLIVAGATEVTSNTATATLLMPILAQMAIQTGIHPLYLMMSATVACSFAFMLPVATPPNAIVFSTGYLTIPDMALAGLPMNFVAVICLTLAINTWGSSMFELSEFPDFFTANVTAPPV